MKKLLIMFVLLLFIAVQAQQINYTWGYSAAGTAYTQTGSADLDSNGTVTIVFDMQDYYYMDWHPLTVNEIYTFMGTGYDDSIDTGVDSIAQSGSTVATVYSNSTRLYYGTFWYRWDLENAADSVYYTVKAYPGNLIYHPNDGSRITASNINWSTTATTLVDTTSGTYTTDDIQWTAVNVYLGSVSKVLPPEFIKVILDLEGVSCDSIDSKWNFAYPALLEYYQDMRRTTQSDNDAAKETKSMH